MDKTYKLTWFSLYHGKHYSKIVTAENAEQAEKIADLSFNCKIEEVKSDTKVVETIFDAEALLYEMDANSCDSITIREGFNKRKTYSRKAVLNSLNLGD